MSVVIADPRALLRGIFEAGVRAVQADICVPAHLPAPPQAGRTIVVGAGKAAAAMARAFERHWSGELAGCVVVPDGYGADCRRIDVMTAAHPIADERSVAAARRMLDCVRAAGRDDLVVALISGGASAAMALPAEGVSLAEKQSIVAALLRAGAAIHELNCVRKHLSAVKGGHLAAATRARIVNLVISDVVGDDPSVIASGPTVADSTTCADALRIADKYAVSLPPHIKTALQSGALETPKHARAAIETRIIASPGDMLAAAADHARGQGLRVLNLGAHCEGEASTFAHGQAKLARDIAGGAGSVPPPCVILSGGELTVRVSGKGRGGPNTEFALAFAREAGQMWALAADTDGRDGNSGAAGAFVTPETLARAYAAGLDPQRSLAGNDSAAFFGALDDLFDPGPTLTNVNDLRAILVTAESRQG